MDISYMIIELVDVISVEEEHKSFYTQKRNYSSLSFRIDTKECFFKYKGKVHPAKTGDICFAPQNAEYSVIAKKDKVIVFHFNFYNCSVELQIFQLLQSEKYRQLFIKGYNIWQEKKVGYRYKATSVLYEILSELQADGALVDSAVDRDIAKALNEIEANFPNAEFRIENLAKKLFVSDSFLRSKFKKQVGLSPKKYLINRRIREAEIMLKSKYYSQEKISQKCGFSGVKYFRNAFKTVTGKTVSEYKKDI